jgi:hypothetical protein
MEVASPARPPPIIATSYSELVAIDTFNNIYDRNLIFNPVHPGSKLNTYQHKQ